MHAIYFYGSAAVVGLALSLLVAWAADALPWRKVK